MVSWCIVKYRMFVFLLLSHENKTGKTTQVSSKSVPIPILPVSSPPAMADCPFQAADQSMPEDVKAIRSTLAAVADPQVGHGARPPSDGMAVPSAQCVSDVPRTGTSCWLAKQKCPPFSPPKASAHGDERAPMCNLQSTTHAKGIQSQTRNASALHIWRLSQLDRSVHCARTLLPMRQETPFPMSD